MYFLQVLNLPGSMPKGDKLIFQDRKGYEDALRKHHTSSVTRDIWVYDIKKDDYTQVSHLKVKTANRYGAEMITASIS